MNKELKSMYLYKNTIGYWSMLGGVEIKDVITGIVDYVVIVANSFGSPKSVHKLKLNYNSKKDDYYINLYGNRLWLNEAIRNQFLQ